MIGKTLCHYEILELLGSGGMGDVYRARDSKLDRDVAIKVLPEDLDADPDRLARLEREAKLLAALNHANIATIHSLEEDQGARFLVLELIKGRSLGQMLAQGPLAVDKALYVCRQIAEALEAAHGESIIHRDLKPANVIITPQGKAKVLDFGIAKSMAAGAEVAGTDLQTNLTTTGAIVGTPSYMSPEQVRGKPLDERTDIWSFGCVLYETLAGRSAFGLETIADTLAAILEHEPRWDDLPPETPGCVRTLLARMLQKDQQRRLRDIGDARLELEDARAGPGSSPADAAAPAAVAPTVTGQIRSQISSVAVLPLLNLSGLAEQDYFSDGMTEALITDLAKIGGLRIISRTSVMRFKGSDKPLPEIARELGVDAVVEGSVLRAGDRVRINAQLIHGASDSNLWADSYDRPASDVFSLQSEVARAIAAEVKVKLSPQEEALLATGPAIDPLAHDEYLRGRHHLAKLTVDAMNTAMSFFRKAIEIDPLYAAAYAGMADAYGFLGQFKAIPADEAFARSKAAARKAVELDGLLAEARVSLGFTAMFCDWDWVTAEREYRHAIELNPSSSLAHMYYSFFLVAQARFDEAIAEIKLAQQLDPLSAWVGANVGVPFYWAGRYDEAADAARKALELEPDQPLANAGLGVSYAGMGRLGEAIEALRATLPSGDGFLGFLGHAHALNGDTAEATEILERLEELRRGGQASAEDIARVHIGLGHTDQAFEWLDKALDERAGFIVYLKVDPSYESMHADERFEVLLERLGLAD